GEAHAEIRALADARQRGQSVQGACACVTLEPCNHHGRTPPCADALIEAGVHRVVLGARDPNPQSDGRRIDRRRAAGVDALAGVAVAACAATSPGLNLRLQRGRPRVRVKLAMTLDGRTAAANGESQWITGDAARSDGHRLRAESGAVLVGSATALDDDPSLTVRLPGNWRQPLRVVLDSKLRLSPQARMLGLPGTTRIYTVQDPESPAWRTLEAGGAELRRVGQAQGRPDPLQVLEDLAGSGINDVLVEAGPTLAGALTEQGLVDEFILYMAPQLQGEAGHGVEDRKSTR